LGAREALLHNRDPYSAAVTREIQLGFYGRQIDPNNPSDPKDQVAFAYPLYVIFLFWPTTALPFHTVLRMFQCLASSGQVNRRAAGMHSLCTVLAVEKRSRRYPSI
jgi:hypothetical protein